MIFLYKYSDEDQDEDIPKCPRHLWFANQVCSKSVNPGCPTDLFQTINNACATVALLNIVMNVEEIDLGEELGKFKSSTQQLKPAYRGKSLGEHGFIRNIHNSFAR